MSEWPTVALEKVLRHRKEFVVIDDLATYKRCRVQLHVKGIVRRDEVLGAQLRTKRQQICRAGDFLVAEIDAKVGGFGIVPAELEGAIVSSHYFLFEIDEGQLDRGFLDYFVRTPVFRKQVEAQGSTNYAAIRPSDVLSYAIRLPPLSEQRQIVTRIEAVNARVAQAGVLADQVARETAALCRAVIADASHGPAAMTPMRELVRLRPPDVVVDRGQSYDFAGVYCFGRGVFRGARRSGMEFSYERLTRLRTDDLVYPKLMAWEGAFGVVPPECDGLVVSTEFPVFEVKTERVLPEVLDVYFRSPSVWPLVSSMSTGTNVRRRRLNPEKFLAFEMPLPPKAVQQRLRDIKCGTGQIQRTRAEASRELEAVPRAIVAHLLGA